MRLYFVLGSKLCLQKCIYLLFFRVVFDVVYIRHICCVVRIPILAFDNSSSYSLMDGVYWIDSSHLPYTLLSVNILCETLLSKGTPSMSNA